MQRPSTTVLVIAITAMFSSSAARAAAPAPAARAADLYRRATQLYAAKKLAEAEPLYREAWALHPTYDVACNMGALELELGRPVRAAALLTYAVQAFPAGGRAEARVALEQRLAEAQKRVGTLRIGVGAVGADVLVDGHSVGNAPLAPQVFVEPGERVVEAKLKGYGDMRLSVNVAASKTYDVRLPLTQLKPLKVKRSAVPLILGGVAGALAAGTGAAFLVLAEKQRRDAYAQHDAIAGAHDSCAFISTRCSDLHATTKRADALGNAGITALTIAGIAAAGTVTYAIWPSLKFWSSKPINMQASLSVGPGAGTAQITGSF